MFHLLAQSLPTVLLAAGLPVAETHGASCAAPFGPARVARTVVPQAPPIADLLHLTGTTLVRVVLSATGSVEGTSVAHSSGSPMLDRAALPDRKSASLRA